MLRTLQRMMLRTYPAKPFTSFLKLSCPYLAAREGWRLLLRKCTLHTTVALQVVIFVLVMQMRTCNWRAGIPFQVAAFSGWRCESALPNNTCALKSCDFRAGAAEARFAHHLWTLPLTILQPELRDALCAQLERDSRKTFVRKPSHFRLKRCDFRTSTWSCGSALPVLLLYLTTAILQPEL